MSHYHLANLVKFDPSSFQKTPHTTFTCLHLLTKQNEPNPLEHLYIYAHNDSDIPSTETEFLLADFMYKNDNIDVRCKVLCPIINIPTNWKHFGVNFYIIPFGKEHHGVRGLSGCSPKGYAYHDGSTIYYYQIDGNKFAAMYCFPDKENFLAAPYFAFCKIKEEHESFIDVEWAHHDNPYIEKTYFCHEKVEPAK